MPDLVIAFTSVPLDPPWVASNRLATNSNSAIASLLYFGCPKPRGLVLGDAQPVDVQLERAEAGPGLVVDEAFWRLPGASSDEVDEVAAVERQVLHLPRIDVAADGGAGAIDQRRGAGDGHRLLERRRRHLEVDDRLLSDQQLDAGAGQRWRSPASSAEMR